MVNGKQTQVTMLQQSNLGSGFFWAEAVCIGQKDNAEKAEHIQLTATGKASQLCAGTTIDLPEIDCMLTSYKRLVMMGALPFRTAIHRNLSAVLHFLEAQSLILPLSEIWNEG